MSTRSRRPGRSQVSRRRSGSHESRSGEEKGWQLFADERPVIAGAEVFRQTVSVITLWPVDRPVIVRSEGLVLREWSPDDADMMVRLFDTEQMNRWTPLASPFDRDVALRYVQQAHQSRRDTGMLQLAVTEDGASPLGEVLIFPWDADKTVELAYAIGAPFQGRGLARRAIAAALAIAASAGMETARLTIATDNVPSQRTAVAAGFGLTQELLTQRSRKGIELTMATWQRSLTRA